MSYVTLITIRYLVRVAHIQFEAQISNVLVKGFFHFGNLDIKMPFRCRYEFVSFIQSINSCRNGFPIAFYIPSINRAFFQEKILYSTVIPSIVSPRDIKGISIVFHISCLIKISTLISIKRLFMPKGPNCLWVSRRNLLEEIRRTHCHLLPHFPNSP